MFAFFATPLGRRLGVAVGTILAVVMLLRWYGNRQYYAGRDEERKAFGGDMLKVANQARNSARAELQKERDALATAGDQMRQARAQFDRDRAKSDGIVRDRLASIDATLREDNSRVVSTPDSGLSDLIRSQVADIRARRAAIASPQQ